MRSLSLRIFVVLFWLIWAGVVVPFHTRGAISAGGEKCAACEGTRVGMMFDELPRSCCAGKGGKPEKTPARSAENCAICQVMAHATVTAVIPWVAPRMDLICRGEPSYSEQLPGGLFLGTIRSRAPPGV